jgi:hypothetical protein
MVWSAQRLAASRPDFSSGRRAGRPPGGQRFCVASLAPAFSFRRCSPLSAAVSCDAARSQQAGFLYSKEEMLEIYRRGDFKNAEFSDKFQQVPNATTPEFLIPLALLPIEDEERDLRLNPVVTGNPQGQGGGRGRGGGFQDREGGRGKGKGERGGKGEREGKGGREGWGRNQEGGEVRNSGGSRWDDRGRDDRRGQRDSNGANQRDSDTLDADASPAFGATPAPSLPPPAPPKDWFYRDLNGTVQGPFAEAQISEWFSAGYLPAELPMRPADVDAYTPLNELVSATTISRRHTIAPPPHHRRATTGHTSAPPHMRPLLRAARPLGATARTGRARGGACDVLC